MVIRYEDGHSAQPPQYPHRKRKTLEASILSPSSAVGERESNIWRQGVEGGGSARFAQRWMVSEMRERWEMMSEATTEVVANAKNAKTYS